MASSKFFSVMTFNLHLLVQRTSYPSEIPAQLYEEPSILNQVLPEIINRRPNVVLLQEVPTQAFYASTKKNRKDKTPFPQPDLELEKGLQYAGYTKVVCSVMSNSPFLQNCIYIKDAGVVMGVSTVSLSLKRSMAIADLNLGQGRIIKVIATHVDKFTIEELADAVSGFSAESVIIGADFNLPLEKIQIADLAQYKASQDCPASGKPAFPHQVTMATQNGTLVGGEEVDYLLLSPVAQTMMIAVRQEYGQLISDHCYVFTNFVLL